jgi:hypothetical protein
MFDQAPTTDRRRNAERTREPQECLRIDTTMSAHGPSARPAGSAGGSSAPTDPEGFASRPEAQKQLEGRRLEEGRSASCAGRIEVGKAIPRDGSADPAFCAAPAVGDLGSE